VQLTAAEAQTLERLKATPFGTWLEVFGVSRTITPA
jgi:hypothetical protein